MIQLLALDIRMKLSRLLFFVCMIFAGIGLYGQQWQALYEEVSLEELRFKVKDCNLVEINFSDLQSTTFQDAQRSESFWMELPMPDGSLKNFHFRLDPVMEPGLQQKFPEIKTWIIESGKYKGRADVNLFGFHAMINSPEGVVLIDPAKEGSKDYYMSYYSTSLLSDGRAPFSCQVDENILPEDTDFLPSSSSRQVQSMGMGRASSPVVLRTYRTAVSTTGEYAQFHGGTVAGAMSAIVTTINRVNTVYQPELAIKLVLIENNDELIFLDPNTDPFTNNDLSRMLNENLATINEIIGFANYDVGHVFGTNGGGLAQLGSVCGTGKARGGTGLPNPRGDFFDVVYVGHEFGHQFAAAHTFNNCNGNESPGTAFEPGSGTTIMAYAGLCGPNNVQVATDFYFHNASLVQVRNFLESGGGSTCGLHEETDNTHPTVSIEVMQNLVLPIMTPFELRGSAEDAEGGNITMNWEQWDLGPQSDLGNPLGNAPLFRSQVPQSSGLRILPNIQNVLSGTSNIREVLPNRTRPVTFRFTARDNNSIAGGASWTQLNMSATLDAGPFLVNNPLADDRLVTGQFYELQWDVAATNLSPVNAAYVDILISRNGGLSFPDTLLRKVPNTGSVLMVMPLQTSNNSRIKIAGHNHIFFQVNPGNFSIVEPDTAAYTFIPEVPRELICVPSTLQIPIQTAGLRSYEGTVRFELLDSLLPADIRFSYSRTEVDAGEALFLELDMTDYRGIGTFSFEIWGISDELGDTLRFPIELNTQRFLNETALPLSPDPGQLSTPAPISFEWTEVEGAEHYNFFIWNKSSFPGNPLQARSGLTGTQFSPPILYETSEVYLWVVEAENQCGVISETVPNTFQTEVLSCTRYHKDESVLISATGTPTILSEIFVPIGAELASVEVFNISGAHQSFNDMDFWLFDPQDNGIRLLGRSCSTYGGPFDLSFSDLSARGFSCPPNQEEVFRPAQALNTFQGVNSGGTWTLRIRDVVSGGGGSFDSWSLNLCVNAPSSIPEILVNETMVLQPGTERILSNSLLHAVDAVKSPDQLIYTLLTVPSKGGLYFPFGTQPMSPGTQFTQGNIDRLDIEYRHDGDELEEDEFWFIVTHEDGGFIASQPFLIRTDDDFVSSTKEREVSTLAMQIFPNPVASELSIRFTQPVNEPFLQVLNTSGQILFTQQIQGDIKEWHMQMNQWPSGMYLLSVISREGVLTKSFIKE